MKVYAVCYGHYEQWTAAVYSTRELAQARINADSFDDYYDDGRIEVWNVDDERVAPPKSMNVHGNFGDDALGDCDFEDGDELPWKFIVKHDEYGEYVEFTGSVAILPGEVVSEYYERAKDVVIDKYEEWKVKRNG